MTRPGLEPRPIDLESSAPNTGLACLTLGNCSRSVITELDFLSVSSRLEVGKAYYVEVLQKQKYGQDHVEVAVT